MSTGGAQGVWVDKERTSSLAPDGVAVALLHTGSSYADDLAEDCVLYHYPATNRPPSRDKGEIDATKNAGRFGLPVFVISYPSPNSSLRDAALAWVEGWDDDLGMFLVTFGEDQPDVPDTDPIDDSDFRLTEETSKKKRQATVREGQQRFQFAVLQRYGRRCAVCGIIAPEVLDAVHLRPKAKKGSDHAGNGLVLCATHHRAQEAGLFGIEPETTRLVARDGGVSLGDRHQVRRREPHTGATARGGAAVAVGGLAADAAYTSLNTGSTISISTATPSICSRSYSPKLDAT